MGPEPFTTLIVYLLTCSALVIRCAVKPRLSENVKTEISLFLVSPIAYYKISTLFFFIICICNKGNYFISLLLINYITYGAIINFVIALQQPFKQIITL